ncbi:MAG TPA: hypothetical protein VF189_05630 [Patescibacteria group bacterium]
MANSELGPKVKAYSEMAGGIVAEGVGIKVNPVLLGAPADAAKSFAETVLNGSADNIFSAFGHDVLGILNAYVHSGFTGLAASAVLAFGIYLYGKGRVDNHVAKVGA